MANKEIFEEENSNKANNCLAIQEIRYDTNNIVLRLKFVIAKSK